MSSIGKPPAGDVSKRPPAGQAEARRDTRLAEARLAGAKAALAALRPRLKPLITIAQQSRSQREHLRKLHRQLAQAATMPRTTSRQRLMASTVSFVSVLEFLAKHEPLRDHALLAPLHELFDQLASLVIGGRADMLQLKTTLKTHHTPARALLDAYAAAAIEALRLEGVGLEEACTSVSQWMPAHNRRSPTELMEKRKRFKRKLPALGLDNFHDAVPNYRAMLKQAGPAQLKVRFSLLAESLSF
jgi:hypothetical protein